MQIKHWYGTLLHNNKKVMQIDCFVFIKQEVECRILSQLN